MKRLSFFLIVFFYSCFNSPQKIPVQEKKVGDEYRIVVVDSCEYILFTGHNAELRYDGITHKGNCKNCNR